MRLSKRSKFEELVQEVQSIKQAVAPKQPPPPASLGQLPLPPVPPPPPHLPSPRAVDQPRLYAATPSFPAGTSPLSSIPSFSTAPPPRTVLETSSGPGLASPAQMTTPSSTSGRTSQPRALKSKVFSGQDIDHYFDRYFEHCHPYFPIVRIREPDAVYNSGPVLFWAIVVTACRTSSHAGGVFELLADAVKKEVWESVSDPPVSLATINALLILSVWPLPTIRFVKDPSPMYVSLLMNSCYLLGIHTGRGDYPAHTYPAYRLSVSNEEAVYSWIGYNIISQRVSTYSGTPSTGQFFNRTIESVLDGTSPVQIPTHFHVLLESAAYLHRVGGIMAANIEGGNGVSHLVVQQLEEDFQKVQMLMSRDISDAAEVDRFTILSTLQEIQLFYFMPMPGFSPEIFKRNALRCHTTAQSVVRLALKLQSDIGFLSHAPHFVCRSVLTAACILISAFLSPSLKDVIERHTRECGGTPDMVVGEALACVRYCSIQEGDLPVRTAKMMESAWHVRDVLPPTEISHADFIHRMGMGLPLDCIRRWKRQMEQIRPDKVSPSVPAPGAGAGAGAGGADLQAGAAGAGAAGGGGGGGAGGADLLATDPFSRIDWEAFMKDFDWNFDPNLMDTVVA
ncbi:hypothetical protein SLS53_004726 [Cytospora paraplurivora]|uniref:Transcription factor domain-containing protein n=1 Tax=Cytospora paraplurivora TaxID=2898453 RepID=A0AAN9U7P4_9PEZI